MVPGLSNDQSSHQSKLAGVYDILAFTTCVCEYYHITKGSIKIGCNGEQAIEAIFTPNNVTSRTKYFDLIITAPHKLVKESPLDWTFRHVKGHQDNFTATLDKWAGMNIEVDLEANYYWEEARPANTDPQQTIWGEPWSLWIGDQKLTGKIRKQVYDSIHDPLAHKYGQNH